MKKSQEPFLLSDDETQNIDDAAADSRQLLFLPPSRFVSSQTNPRTEWEVGAVEEIALSVADLRTRGRGVGGTGYQHPISVRLPPGILDASGAFKRTDFQFLISIGETRWRAGTLLSTVGLLDTRDTPNERLIRIPDLVIPAYIENVGDDEARELGYYENKKRRNLSPLDEARFLLWMKQRYNLTIPMVASRVGEDAGYVQNRLDGLNAGEDVQRMLTLRHDSLAIARRIDKIDPVKRPKERERAIEMVLEGVPKVKVEAYVNHVRALDPKPLPAYAGTRLQQRYLEQKQAKRSDVPTIPAFDTGEALDKIYRDIMRVNGSLRDVKPSKQRREELKEKIALSQELLSAMVKNLEN